MYYSLINSMNRAVVSSYTARTTAFATATGITDPTILNALNTFDLGLISNSLDTKTKAIYPMVGGTSTTCKYNFMDARDLDVAFRLQFNGGITFSSNGALPNGTNGFANTYYTPPIGNAGMFFYARTDTNRFECNIGAYNSASSSQSVIFITGESYFSMNSSVFAYVRSPLVQRLGFYAVNRIGNDVTAHYRGGTVTAFADKVPTSLPLNLFNRAGSNDLYALNECAGAGLVENYTISEMNILKTLIDNLQTTLSRAV
jgi:hypothetical protein